MKLNNIVNYINIFLFIIIIIIIINKINFIENFKICGSICNNDIECDNPLIYNCINNKCCIN